MTTARLIDDCEHFVPVVQQSQALNAFLQPDCPAVLWQRNHLPDLSSWVGELAPANLPEGRLKLRTGLIPQAIHRWCEIAGTPKCFERDLLISDIQLVCESFSRLMRTDHLLVRLEKVSDNACCKFHKDAITARLVCTYRGTGTQYGISKDGQEPKRTFTAPTGSPLLLRGALWSEQPESNLKHRSPPIIGTGETRLVLVLDPISFPS